MEFGRAALEAAGNDMFLDRLVCESDALNSQSNTGGGSNLADVLLVGGDNRISTTYSAFDNGDIDDVAVTCFAGECANPSR